MMHLPRRNAVPALLLTALLAALAADAVCAQTAPADSAAAGSGMAIVLFIDGRPQAGAPVDVVELRQAMLSRLHAAARAAGHATAPQEAVEAAVVDLRVRSGAALPPAFLEILRRETGAATLLVATLLADEGRFLVAARQLSTRDGTLHHVALTERMLPPGEDADDARTRPDGDARPWRTALQECARDVMPPAAPVSPQGPLMLVQPTIGAGLASSSVTMAAHCMIREILDDGHWRLLDPALVRGALQQDGLDPGVLDAAGRRLLVREFAPSVLLMTELLSYEDRGHQATTLLVEGVVAARNLPAYAWHLRLVDPGTGVVTGSCEILDDRSGSVGWFGVRHNPTMLLQLEDAAARLWQLARPQLEDN
jgi:hypothetical protein